MGLSSTAVIVLASVGLVCVIVVILVVVVARASLSQNQNTRDHLAPAPVGNQHQVPAPIRRIDTPEATIVTGVRPSSVNGIPTATTTGIRRCVTVDAEVAMPPALTTEMQNVPDATATATPVASATARPVTTTNLPVFF